MPSATIGGEEEKVRGWRTGFRADEDGVNLCPVVDLMGEVAHESIAAFRVGLGGVQDDGSAEAVIGSHDGQVVEGPVFAKIIASNLQSPLRPRLRWGFQGPSVVVDMPQGQEGDGDEKKPE